MCVILDTCNNNTQIPVEKTRITHNGGSKVLSRRKQTNKKNIIGQKDVWHGTTHYTSILTDNQYFTNVNKLMMKKLI